MKIDFLWQPIVDPEVRARHVALNKARVLPAIEPARGRWKTEPLAVVGAGPSVAEHIDELRRWPGPRWAVNNAHRWCREQGIDATFMTVDPGVWQWDFRPGERALVATQCDPGLFEALDGCEITTFDFGEGGITAASTSASAALTLGPIMGYRHVSFFGCESSHLNGVTHVNELIPPKNWMLVLCDGEVYVTTPQMALQAEGLALIIRACPDVFTERSGGFLGAMVRAGDYDVVNVAEGLIAAPTALLPDPRSQDERTPHGDRWTPP